jgi:nicotinamidase-related amidase
VKATSFQYVYTHHTRSPAADACKIANQLAKAVREYIVCIARLAMDYCITDSVLDALKEGLKVFILTDAIAGVNSNLMIPA